MHVRPARSVAVSLMFAAIGVATALPVAAGAATGPAPTTGPSTLPSTNLVPGPPTGASQPDDLTSLAVPGVDGGLPVLWTEFQNGVNPDGTPGPGGVTNSTVAGFDASTGTLVKSFSVPGHVDGLTADPFLHQLIATTNEDANS